MGCIPKYRNPNIYNSTEIGTSSPKITQLNLNFPLSALRSHTQIPLCSDEHIVNGPVWVTVFASGSTFQQGSPLRQWAMMLPQPRSPPWLRLISSLPPPDSELALSWRLFQTCHRLPIYIRFPFFSPVPPQLSPFALPCNREREKKWEDLSSTFWTPSGSSSKLSHHHPLFALHHTRRILVHSNHGINDSLS
jgi:hypothetical protein